MEIAPRVNEDSLRASISDRYIGSPSFDLSLSSAPFSSSLSCPPSSVTTVLWIYCCALSPNREIPRRILSKLENAPSIFQDLPVGSWTLGYTIGSLDSACLIRQTEREIIFWSMHVCVSKAQWILFPLGLFLWRQEESCGSFLRIS